MKRLIKIFSITALGVLFSLAVSAQNPPHPNGGNAPGSGNTPVGGGAPIGNGLVVMLVAAAAYKLKEYRKLMD
ncbi:MAG: hypothetical protein Kow00127_11210 [Bacteroidales bacterium]